MQCALTGGRYLGRYGVAGLVFVRWHGWEAADRIGDKHAGTDQTNAGCRDQPRNDTRTHAGAGAPAQTSSGTGVEHAGEDEVRALVPPSITSRERTHCVSLPVVPRSPCPDRRETDDEQWSGHDSARDLKHDSARDLNRKLGSVRVAIPTLHTLLPVAIRTSHGLSLVTAGLESTTALASSSTRVGLLSPSAPWVPIGATAIWRRA